MAGCVDRASRGERGLAGELGQELGAVVALAVIGVPDTREVAAVAMVWRRGPY